MSPAPTGVSEWHMHSLPPHRYPRWEVGTLGLVSPLTPGGGSPQGDAQHQRVAPRRGAGRSPGNLPGPGGPQPSWLPLGPPSYPPTPRQPRSAEKNAETVTCELKGAWDHDGSHGLGRTFWKETVGMGRRTHRCRLPLTLPSRGPLPPRSGGYLFCWISAYSFRFCARSASLSSDVDSWL